jgi:uncharacterized ubiquitin-like protein YukD
MYITITLTTPEDQSFDIQIDGRQRISAAAEILTSTGKIKHRPADFYRSKMQKRIVSSYNSFIQENIQTGDELIMLA